jgi:hypothetical protein
MLQTSNINERIGGKAARRHLPPCRKIGRTIGGMMGWGALTVAF